jgi:hypothetical protein
MILILILAYPLTTSTAAEEDKPYELIKVIDPPEPHNDGYFGDNMAMMTHPSLSEGPLLTLFRMMSR